MESALLTCANPNMTPEDWQRTPPSVQQAVLHVLARLAALEEEVGVTVQAVTTGITPRRATSERL